MRTSYRLLSLGDISLPNLLSEPAGTQFGLSAVRSADLSRLGDLYVVRTPERAALQKRLAEQGVETLIHYPTAGHLQPAFAHLGYRRGDFPVAESMADEVLSLPLWPGMPLSDVDAAAAALVL